MAEQSNFVVLVGRKPAVGVLACVQAAAEVREATTGRVVPRVWAVASPRPVGPMHRETEPGGLSEGVARREAGKRSADPSEEYGFYR